MSLHVASSVPVLPIEEVELVLYLLWQNNKPKFFTGVVGSSNAYNGLEVLKFEVFKGWRRRKNRIESR